MPNQNKGTFPSDTQKNPRDCMAIQLRSGKDLNSNKETDAEKEKTEEKAEKNSQLEQLKGSNDQKRKEGGLAYTPAVPFPHRLQKSRREEQFSKFLDFQENRDKYSICRGDQSNASICKISEGDT